MRVLFLSSEVAPYSKTGGLADVAGALPAALTHLGHEVRVMTPGYAPVRAEGLKPEGQPLTLEFPFGRREVSFRSMQPSKGLTVTLVDEPVSFGRAHHYGEGGHGYPDNAQRFATFSMGALAGAQSFSFFPDVVHLNDWQTGLAALALKRAYAHGPLGTARVVLTLHNLAYQGNFPKDLVPQLGIDWADYTQEGVEFWHELSFLKTGLVFSDAITAVSPTYAKEIQTREGGVGLDGVLRARKNVLSGILNGVDVREWNPATDALLPAQFSSKDLAGRATCREALLARSGVQPAKGQPVFGMVGRMVDQKGVDLAIAALPPTLEAGAALVVLGSGEPQLEEAFRALERRFPQRCKVTVGFDNSLAHLIEAGSDFFLMPSRFEPCGLNQMYSLLYGAVPIVRAVGGLEDTVVDAAEPRGTGLKFRDATVDGVRWALKRAGEVFAQRDVYQGLQRRGMGQDLSWDKAAREYEAVYRARP